MPIIFLAFFGKLPSPSPVITGIYGLLDELLVEVSHTEVRHLGELDARESIS